MNPSKRIPLSVDLIKSLFEYNPETGIIKNQLTRGRGGRPGQIAGGMNQMGYWVVICKGRTIQAHRIAWVFAFNVWPDGEIDHINGVRSDNRICNLRVATRSQNMMNCGKKSNNASGFKGVSWHKLVGKWSAGITVAQKRTHLGVFKDKQEAAAAYAEAAKRLHGEFARLE